MSVSVLNQRQEPLMPCSPRKARMLLKEGKANLEKICYGKGGWRFLPYPKGIGVSFANFYEEFRKIN